MSATLRRALAAAPPHVSLKAAFRQLVVALRAERKVHPGRDRHPLASRAALDRLLAQPLSENKTVAGAKSALSELVRLNENDVARTVVARRAADALLACVPRELPGEARVKVALVDRPPGLVDAGAHALLGTEDGWTTAIEAAAAVHRLSGQVVGGRPLRVQVDLPPGTRLPALARGQRVDRGRWGRDAPWLEHLDELGRRSLTPRPFARRMARRVVGRVARVVDACCGCGGNAIAFAEAGLTVVAVEVDASRAALARKNARARGVANKLTVLDNSVERCLDRLLRPGDLLFVDPPWEGGPRLMGERADDFSAMFRRLPRLAEAVASWPTVLLKLPRAFDVESLPGGATAWHLRYERGAPSSGDARVVRMITATRGLSPRGPGPTR